MLWWNKLRILLCVFVVALFVGCVPSTLPSICDDLGDQPSILCDLTKDENSVFYGVRLEDIGNALIVANAIAIGQNLYTREDATTVLDVFIALLQDPVTSGATFVTEVLDITNEYPGLFEVATVYLSELRLQTQPFLAADRDILSKLLTKQRSILTKN